MVTTRSNQTTRSRTSTIISSTPLGNITSTIDYNIIPNINDHRTTETVDTLRRSSRKKIRPRRHNSFKAIRKQKEKHAAERKLTRIILNGSSAKNVGNGLLFLLHTSRILTLTNIGIAR